MKSHAAFPEIAALGKSIANRLLEKTDCPACATRALLLAVVYAARFEGHSESFMREALGFCWRGSLDLDRYEDYGPSGSSN